MLNIIPADDLTEVADIEDEELCQFLYRITVDEDISFA
jgi:hypothetical protein